MFILFWFQLKSSFMEIQGNNKCFNSSEIAAAEMRKSELLAAKENLHGSLASNYQIRAQLQKQLHRMLLDHTKRKVVPVDSNKLIIGTQTWIRN